MEPTREFEMVEAGTGRRLGSVSMSEAAMPGELLLRFRDGEIQLEAIGPRPTAAPPAPAADPRSSRPTSRKKPA